MIIQGCALNERNKLVLINFADELDALIPQSSFRKL